MSLPEERMHILKMIESGQVKAEEGAQLLAALDEGAMRERPRPGTRAPVLRVRVTDLGSHRQKINVTLPVGLIDVGIKLGARLFPRGGGPTIAEAVTRLASVRRELCSTRRAPATTVTGSSR